MMGPISMGRLGDMNKRIAELGGAVDEGFQEAAWMLSVKFFVRDLSLSPSVIAPLPPCTNPLSASQRPPNRYQKASTPP